MQKNKLRETLKAGKVAIGPFIKLLDPSIVEIAGLAGFDFVIIDMEHGPHTVPTAQNMVRAAKLRGVTPIIRVTENNPAHILRALDIGAEGVQVPQIGNREDALRTVKASKFYPQGERGVCRYVSAADYTATDRFEYFSGSNDQNLTIVHIEGQEGIRNLPEILQVEGLDIVFLGPYDLSQSCGVPGQVDHPLVAEKMQQAVELATQAGVAVGTFVDNVEAGHKWMKLGVQYISFAVDVGIFFEACKGIVERLREKE